MMTMQLISNMDNHSKMWKKLTELLEYFKEQTADELESRHKNLKWVKTQIPVWLKEGGEDHVILCVSFYLFGGDRGQLSEKKQSSVENNDEHSKENQKIPR